MKNGFKILVAGLALLASAQLISCKKEKKEDPSIVGTWESKTFSFVTKLNGVVLSDTTEAFPGLTITFKADNTYNSVDADDASNNDFGTYSTNGSKLYINSTDGSKDTTDFQVTATEFTLSGSEIEKDGSLTYETNTAIKFSRK
jgi:hypothetical protein